MNTRRFQVCPRYTAGAPGEVGEAAAWRLARAERDAYRRALEGPPGSAAAQRAQRAGLAGIAELWERQPEGWIVTDLLTDASIFAIPRGEWISPHLAARLGMKYRVPVRLAS